MKLTVLIAGIAVAASAQAHNSKPVDVTVYVNGDNRPSGPVDLAARATVTWMFAKADVLLTWRDGELGTCAPFGSPVVIEVRYSGEASGRASAGALAYALPFGNRATVISVMYGRIRWVAGRSTREQPILTHVLAHEICHMLQRTNWHSQTGVMKARWNGKDFDAMERQPLRFTSDDVDLIMQGLKALRSRAASRAGCGTR